MMEYFVFFLLSNLCVAQLTDISQPVPFQAAQQGDNITIECQITSSIQMRVWYKLTTGKRLQHVAKINTFYNHVEYSDEFHESGRFSVQLDKVIHHLRISNTIPEDIGTYYCGVVNVDSVVFGHGTFLIVQGAKLERGSTVQQSVSKSVNPGDSVTLNCTVHTGTACAGEHPVYWFRHGSGETGPQLIYTSVNKIDNCETTSMTGSSSHNCIYNLSKSNVSLADAGSYYCAAALCGEVLFGNGATLDIHRTAPEDESLNDLNPTVLVLMASNVILAMGTLLLVWMLCKTRSRDQKGVTDQTSSQSPQPQNGEEVNYAVMSFALRSASSRTARVKSRGDTAVYSEVRYPQQE